MTLDLITSFFLSKILIASIVAVALFLALVVFRNNPKDPKSKIYAMMTMLMIVWVVFAYLPRIIGNSNYIFSLVSLKIAWFATPLFFSHLYLLTVYLFGLEKNYKKLTYLVFTIGALSALMSGLTDFVIVDYVWVKNIIRIIYGQWMLFFLGGISFLIAATFVPILKNKKIIAAKKLSYFIYGLLVFYVFNAIFNITLPVFLDISRFYFLGDYSTLVLLGFTAYSILRQELFNVKVIATEFLSFVIWVALFIRLATSDTGQDRMINGIILFFVTIFIILLIRSVLKEIRTREEKEELAGKLQIANKQQENLIHFINHQVKGFFTKSKYIYSVMLEGDYGILNDKMKSVAREGLRSDNEGIAMVEDILNASNIKSGVMKYSKSLMDFKNLVLSIVFEQEKIARDKNLSFEANIEEENYEILGDEFQLKHLVKNLIDNSIKYTPAGKITVSLSKTGGKILFSVKDTGVGITKEDKERLFTEGGRGKNSQKVNVDSTGFGLFIAKSIVEAHNGKIWAESEGEGKGSAFFVELPAEK